MNTPKEMIERINTVLLTVGTTTSTIAELTKLDLFLSLGLKVTGFISFGCYIIMNHKNIKAGWNDLKKRFK